MIAALLLALAPNLQPVPGAPCVCFPVQHAGARAIPEDPLGKAGWKPARLVDETLRVVHTSDDLFVRAEALRTTLLALGKRAEGAGEDSDASRAARRTLFDGLSADLKRETEIAPYSCARFELDQDVDATSAHLSALPGVARVERSPSKTALLVWFDAQLVSPANLRSHVPSKVEPTIEAPTSIPRAYAAITLAFAGESSTQMGRKVEFDARALAREAVQLQPEDSGLLVLAGMIWFDTGTPTGATFVRDAVRNSKGDEYARKNIRSIFCVFYDADSIEDLETKLERRIQRG